VTNRFVGFGLQAVTQQADITTEAVAGRSVLTPLGAIMIDTNHTPFTSFTPIALVVLSLAASIALLVSFVRVVDDFTELGMQRQALQRATGVWMGDISKEPLEASLPAQTAQEP